MRLIHPVDHRTAGFRVKHIDIALHPLLRVLSRHDVIYPPHPRGKGYSEYSVFFAPGQVDIFVLKDVAVFRPSVRKYRKEFPVLRVGCDDCRIFARTGIIDVMALKRGFLSLRTVLQVKIRHSAREPDVVEYPHPHSPLPGAGNYEPKVVPPALSAEIRVRPALHAELPDPAGIYRVDLPLKHGMLLSVLPEKREQIFRFLPPRKAFFKLFVGHIPSFRLKLFRFFCII